MPEGFESDPEAVGAFAAQVEQLRAALERPSAKAADFGSSWTHHGTDFEHHLAAMAEALTLLRPGAQSDVPDAVAAMNEALASAGEDGEAWDVIGAPLDQQVAAARKLDPGVGTKRRELAGLHWGRIGKDVARLRGLAAAIETLSAVAVEQSLDDYAAAVRVAAAGLESALAGIRTEYEAYRDHSVRSHLNLPDDESEARQKIANWYRATDRVKSDVDALFEVALENLRMVAEAGLLVPGTVAIRAGSRTITVASPDGLGHVKVTVQEAGGSKSYDLDFDAASGMTPMQADPDAEHVLAGTNGKCVIRHGELTITAERSLFDADTITLTLDDGSAPPQTHAVELPPQKPPAPSGKLSGDLVPKQPTGPGTSRAGTGWSVHGDLFDSGDPVYSMHGVLAEDDLDSR